MKGRFAALVASSCILASASIATANAKSPPTGTVLDSPTLTQLGGGKRPLVEKGKVTVLVFFRPEHEYSRLGLEQIARCEKALAGKPVRWVALVSSRYEHAVATRAAKAAGIRMPILVDEKDRVYARLDLVLHPMVVVLDAKGAIASYQPYRKVNFYDMVRGRVLHALGELDDAALAKILRPDAANNSGDEKTALRLVKLGRMLLRRGKHDKARQSAEDAIAHVPELAAAHALRGQALAAAGDCAGALASFQRALELDPEDADATAGKAACEE